MGQDNRQGRLGLKQRDRWRERLRQFMVAQRRKQRQAVLPLRQDRLPNKFHAMSMDQTLKVGCGIALKDFEACSPAKSLKVSEQRLFVAMTSLPQL
eukprot:2263314-Amphidinium_carterae.2